MLLLLSYVQAHFSPFTEWSKGVFSHNTPSMPYVSYLYYLSLYPALVCVRMPPWGSILEMCQTLVTPISPCHLASLLDGWITVTSTLSSLCPLVPHVPLKTEFTRISEEAANILPSGSGTPLLTESSQVIALPLTHTCCLLTPLAWNPPGETEELTNISHSDTYYLAQHWHLSNGTCTWLLFYPRVPWVVGIPERATLHTTAPRGGSATAQRQ